jgi:hypothetical protein
MRRPHVIFNIFLSLALLIGAAGCRDEGLVSYQPVVIDPDLASPRVDAPSIQAEIWVDQFNQREAVLDILWVVDTTESMSDHVQRISENFHRFIDVLVGLDVDFRLALTTVVLSEAGGGGALVGTPAVLTPSDDVETAFAERVNLDFAVGNEEGLESARRVIESGIEGFPREEAMLAVVLLTDADDGSAGSAGFYVRYFLGAKGAGNSDLVRVSAIAGDVPDGCVSPGYEDVWGAGASPARRIYEVVSATGGVFGSICAEDYGPVLDELGLESAGLRRVFPLSSRPDPDTLVVEVDGVEIDRDPATGWQYDEPAQSIRFDGVYLPPAGALIHVRYRVLS